MLYANNWLQHGYRHTSPKISHSAELSPNYTYLNRYTNIRTRVIWVHILYTPILKQMSYIFQMSFLFFFSCSSETGLFVQVVKDNTEDVARTHSDTHTQFPGQTQTPGGVASSHALSPLGDMFRSLPFPFSLDICLSSSLSVSLCPLSLHFSISRCFLSS